MTRPTSETDPKSKLLVQKAIYGVPGDAQRSRDVRARLQQIIDSGARRLDISSLAEGDDPASGVVKTLEAECTAGDKRITLKGTDPQRITLNDTPTVEENELKRIAGGRHYIASPVEANPFEGFCTIPADVDLDKSRVFIELDKLAPEAAANITVNGKYAGGFIGKPFRLEITKHLRTGANTINIAPFAPKTAKLSVYP